MKYLKLYEKHQDIVDICKQYLRNSDTYTINLDGSIDVEGDVFLISRGLTKIPLKFRRVTGHFMINENKLTSLEGSPEYVGGSFQCNKNKLTSLEGSPEYVGGGFHCYDNQLTDLEGSPEYVGGHFGCFNNKLTTLKGSPKHIRGNFHCYENQLTSFEGGPDVVDGGFYCRINDIWNFNNIPKVGVNFDFDANPIVTIFQLIKGVYTSEIVPKRYRKTTDSAKIEMFQYYDIIRNDKTIIIDRLNSFLVDNGLSEVWDNILDLLGKNGYKII